jgi:hypothetical protein
MPTAQLAWRQAGALEPQKGRNIMNRSTPTTMQDIESLVQDVYRQTSPDLAAKARAAMN